MALSNVKRESINGWIDRVRDIVIQASDRTNDIMTHKVLLYGWDDDNLTKRRLHVDENGNLQIEVLVGSVTLDTFSSATNTKVSVGTSSTTLLTSSSTRKYASFVNDSDNVIYLSLSGTAVLNEGIRLNSNGGAFVINLMNLYTGAVTAISSVAGSNVTVVEAT